jgi:hypothetical protein
MGTGASLGKEVVLAASGRAGDIARRGRAGEKSDFFNSLEERLTQFPKEGCRLEEKNTR